MSDWHFGMDYDMWLYPPVDYTDPDYDFELPEPIEAANIEGTLLVNAEDAIEQVRRLQAENAKLRGLVRHMWVANYAGHFSTLPEHQEHQAAVWQRMRDLGMEVGP